MLNNVKFIATADGLSLMATDLEIGVRVPVKGADVLSPGAVLLHSGRMAAILREWNEDDLTIEVEGKDVVVSAVHSTFRLPTENPDEYPSVNACNEPAFTTFPARGMAESLKRTVFACDLDSTRFALGGVLMVMDGGDSSLVATDGRRLARAMVPGESIGDVSSTGPIVPMKAAVVLQRLLTDADTVKASFGLNECWFETDRGLFWCRLVEGRYPKWENVIPNLESWEVDIEMPVGPFASMIRQAAIVADSETRGVNFTFSAGTLQAGATESELGMSRVDMPIAYDGSRMTVKLDYRYLSDFLRVLDATSMFRLRVNSPTMPTLLETDDGYSYVVMPMAQDA